MPGVNTDQVREAVRDIWCLLLGQESYSSGAGWDSGGGDSLSAVEMVLALEGRLGIEIPIDVIIGDVTPEQLVANIVHGTVVPAAPGGPLVFIFPAFSEKDLPAARLALALADHASSVIVDYKYNTSNWVTSDEFNSLEERVVAQITDIQPSGDLNFIGYSWGGALAVNVGALLRANGRNIRNLIVLDQKPFGIAAEHLVGHSTARRIAIAKKKYVEKPWTLERGARFAVRMAFWMRMFWVIRAAVALANLAHQTRLADWLRVRIIEVTQQMFLHQRYYDGNIELLVTADKDVYRDFVSDDLGWARFCERVTVRSVSGDHKGMLDIQNLPGLIPIIARILGAESEQIDPTIPGDPDGILILCGAAGMNIPAMQMIDRQRYRVIEVDLRDWTRGSGLPQHRLLFNAVGDPDQAPAEIAKAKAATALTCGPVINHPDAVLASGRVALSGLLANIEGLRVAKIREYPRSALVAPEAEAVLLGDGFAFPLLVRAPGYQLGRHFNFVPTLEELRYAISKLPGDRILVLEYLDVASVDGKFCKYRVMFVDGVIYPLHMAISDHWKVHYFSAGMAGSAGNRAEEALFLSDMDGFLGPSVIAVLKTVAETLGLDYGGIDFSLDREGRVVIFEANAMMTIANPAPDPIWDYRRQPAEDVRTAFAKMIDRKWSCAKSPLARLVLGAANEAR